MKRKRPLSLLLTAALVFGLLVSSLAQPVQAQGAPNGIGVPYRAPVFSQGENFASDVRLHRYQSHVDFTADSFQLNIDGSILRFQGSNTLNRASYQFEVVDGGNVLDCLGGIIDPATHTYSGSLDISSIPAGKYRFRVYTSDGKENFWTVPGVPLVVTSGDVYIPGSDTNAINQKAMQVLAGLDPRPYANAEDTDTTQEQLAAIRSKALEITRSTADDYEKLRLIHDWVADNICYDDAGFRTGNYGDNSAYGVFTSGIAVCDGYAELTKTMLRCVGIPAVRVVGPIIYINNGNGEWWQPGDGNSNIHAWNATYVRGRWVLLDTTWDSVNRYAQGNKYFADSSHWYFDVTTESFALDHRFQYIPDIHFTVTFDDGSGTPYWSQQATFGCGVELAAPPTRPGAIFGGWYKDPACTTPWEVGSDKIFSDITLYARWDQDNSVYTVTYNSKGGSGVPAATAGFGAVIAPPQNPTRTGYIFTGWYKDAACALPWNFARDTVAGNTTLYAGWTAQPAPPEPEPQPQTQTLTPSTYLSGIRLSAGRLTRAFNPKTTGYTITLGENDGAVTVTPVKDYSGATMTIDGKKVAAKTVKLSAGKSATLAVKVTLGKKSTSYKLTIQRPKSAVNRLTALRATVGTWSQPFDPEVTAYELTLPENVGKVTLSTVKVSAVSSVSPAKASYSLKNGQTVKATFKVKAQSGAVRTYIVTIRRNTSTNANLASLKASVKGLSPAFRSSTTEYSLTLPAKSAAATINAKSADPLSKVTINGAKKSSLKLTLSPGQSATVTVAVTAQSGATKTYAVLVNRQ